MTMFKKETVTLEWGGRPLTLETGRIARQADAAVLATYGETSVLAAVVADKQMKEGMDFFPLTVNYIEKFYATGRVPGGFLKREGRPSEKETLVSRLIDRPIRPLFADGFRNETQVTTMVVSYDQENDADIVAMVAASAALTLSGLPFMGPIAAARVGVINDEYVLNPTTDQMQDTALDLVVAGTQNATMMVESEAQELSEEKMLGAVMFGQQGFQPVIDAIIKLAEKAAKEPWDFAPPDLSSQKQQIRDLSEAQLAKAYKISDKAERQNAVAAVKEEASAKFLQSEENPDGMDATSFKDVFKSVEADIVRGDILSSGERIDGRKLADVRPIEAEVTVLPRTHGSALFTRGETQALVVATLGTKDDLQLIDGLDGKRDNGFMLHYNFPPYSVGETGRMGATSRREVGHGKLAWRALKALIPSQEEFPYTLRLVSEITESNGSSSMATVCGCSLAMMDAGVPLKSPVSGIAMGLIKEGEKFAVLSDILGDEDHLGDMDFKVAGSESGVTSLQMDIKIAGITEEIMRTALDQAKVGRMHILGEMNKALDGSRGEVSDFAPRIEKMKIPLDKVREVIGTGGKVIKEIEATSGARLSIDGDEGIVEISSSDGEQIRAAIQMVKSIVDEPEVGEIYQGTVVKNMDFGAFVNFFGKKDGLVHISQLADYRVEKVSDIVKEGDKVWVKLMGIDDRGKVKLSIKVVDQKTGLEIGA